MFNFIVFALIFGFSSGVLFDDMPTFSDGVSVGTIMAEELTDISGCAVSRKFPDTIYVHNDQVDTYARLFALDANTAQVVAVMNVTGATNNDWEDIAVGPCAPDDTASCIYVLDDGTRNDVAMRTVYKIMEPDVDALDDSVVLSVDAKLVYEWSETQGTTLMVDPQVTMYIISNVQDGQGLIVKIPASAWGQDTPMPVDSMDHFAMNSSNYGPSGGDISPDGMEMLVRHVEAVYYYVPSDGDFVPGLTQPGYLVSMPNEPKGEAVCWAADASVYYTLSEGSNQDLYKYTRE